jgi:hypothetical protein
MTSPVQGSTRPKAQLQITCNYIAQGLAVNVRRARESLPVDKVDHQ